MLSFYKKIFIKNCIKYNRLFSTKNKRSILRQNKEAIPVYEYPRPKESDSKVYVWGFNETGALGVQTSLKKQSMKNVAFIQHPTRLHFAETENIIDIACGYGFSAFAVKRTDDFSLFGTGINSDSQLGYHKHRGETNRPIELLIYPAPIVLPGSDVNEKIQIKTCSAGRAHLLALSENGILYTLGNNSYGQCGREIIEDEKYTGSSVVHKIDNIINDGVIEKIICGQDHSILITNNGKVFSFGWGADGQTGLGNYNSISIPTLVKGDIENEKIIKVACTADCVLALNDKGEVFGWGNAEYGQMECLDDNPQINVPMLLNGLKGIGKIVDIAAGGSFCMVLNENGDVFIWGYGLLGMGPIVDHKKNPTQIPPTLFGRNEFNPNTHVTSIYCGVFHMGAINDNNDLYMWGKNKHGCLGLGHTNDQYFPFKASLSAKVMKISCGVDHTLALCKAFI